MHVLKYTTPVRSNQPFKRNFVQPLKNPFGSAKPVANSAAKTSWQGVGDWYDNLVGQSGHYYHQQVILPYLKKSWPVETGESVLDLGCGQGILAKFLGSEVKFVGVDIAKKLIEAAEHDGKRKNHNYVVADVTQDLTQRLAPAKKNLEINEFDHVACVLALQNMQQPEGCIKNLATQLKSGGTGVLVLNHPCFRIPRQSGWDINSATKLQYRWINRYLTPLEIPIKAHPGQTGGALTWSYHHALQDYVGWLKAAGLALTDLAELTSDKESVGKAAKSENRSRSEIPLFLVIQFKKL